MLTFAPVLTHIGSILEERLGATNKSDLARKMGYADRSSLYHHFKNEKPPLHVLVKIQKLTKINLSDLMEEYKGDLLDQTLGEREEDYGLMTKEEHRRDVERLEKRIVELLEELNIVRAENSDLLRKGNKSDASDKTDKVQKRKHQKGRSKG